MRLLTNSFFILCFSSCSFKNSQAGNLLGLGNIFDNLTRIISPTLENDNSCSGKGKSLYVNANLKKLHVCMQGKTIESFDVSMGSGGLGKSKKGDRKTPLGIYGLGEPRKSRKKFYKFMHVQYPTRSQRADGYTGSDVGVHGPPVRGNSFKSKNKRNWGAGCIVLGTDEDTDKVASYVAENRIRKIIILN